MKWPIILFMLAIRLLASNSLSVYNGNSVDVLKNTRYCVDDTHTELMEIKDKNCFKNEGKSSLSLGILQDKKLWLKFRLKNTSNLEKLALIIKNPLLEEIVLYSDGNDIKKGSYYSEDNYTLHNFFTINIKTGEEKRFIMSVSNRHNTMQLQIKLDSFANFYTHNTMQIIIVSTLFGIIIALFLYNFLLYIYTRKRAYAYYCLYILSLTYQQLSYSGLLAILTPSEFIYLDSETFVLSASFIYISAAMFAKEFLKTNRFPMLDMGYNAIILISTVEVPLIGGFVYYSPELSSLSGALFIFYNLYASVYVLRKGYKQARFFVAGWSIMAMSLFVMISDTLGWSNVIHYFPNYVLYSLMVEALLLSLAFADEYMILKAEKENSDKTIMEMLQTKQKEIELEIEKKTLSLQKALSHNELLLKELQHRIKNNLQIILSIIRIQSETIAENCKNSLVNISNRILSISSTYEMLHVENGAEVVSADEQIRALCDVLSDSLLVDDVDWIVNTHDVNLPIREASYIGLILTEIITNYAKHSKVDNLKVYIELSKSSNGYTLEAWSNNKEKVIIHKKTNSLGLTIIDTLVSAQLQGTLKILTDKGMKYLIRFQL